LQVDGLRNQAMESGAPQHESPATADRGVPIAAYRPTPGAHLCSLWTDPATDRRAAAAFLCTPDPGERALCVLERSLEGEQQTRSMAGALAEAGVEVFLTDDVHVAGGIFDPERMRTFWRDQAQRASQGGARHLRAVAEMAWALRGCPGTDQAPLFESSLNPHLRPLPMSVVCQYGCPRFGPDLLLGIVLSHPLIVIGERVLTNPFAVDHERFAAHYDALRADPVAALVPVWAYFLAAQPALRSLGLFLCNSLPTLLRADRVLVDLRGLGSPLRLVVRDDRLDAGGPSSGPTAPASPDGLAVCAEGPWGGVRSGRAHGQGTMFASFADDAGRVVVTRDGAYSGQDELRFTTLVWYAAHAIRIMKETPVGPDVHPPRPGYRDQARHAAPRP
jgi:hypothetical protein